MHKEWRLGIRHHDHRSATRDCPWTTSIQCVHHITSHHWRHFYKSTTFATTYTQTTLNSTSLSHQLTTHKPSRVWKPSYKMPKHGYVTMDLWWITTHRKPFIHSSSLRMPTLLTHVNIYICGQLVDTSPVILGLGFTNDTNLSMTSQVATVCRSAYYHLSRIGKIRDSVSTTVYSSFIHRLVTSWIEYGSAILFGISNRHLHRLEMVQHSAALIVMQIQRGDRKSMTTILRQLHWLPVRKRIESTHMIFELNLLFYTYNINIYIYIYY